MSPGHHVKAIKMLCEFLSGEATLIRPHHSVVCRPHFMAKYYYLWNVEGHNGMEGIRSVRQIQMGDKLHIISVEGRANEREQQ